VADRAVCYDRDRFMRVLLLTPPLTQPNTPYPATPYLVGFLRLHAARLGLTVTQADPAIELFLRVFTRPSLQRIVDELLARGGRVGRRGRTTRTPASIRHFLAERRRYLETVEPVIRFLQGRDPSLALRIASRSWLPEGPRFADLGAGGADDDVDPMAWAFGALGVLDRAKHVASLYIDDLADLIRDGIDARFGLCRYAESLAARAPTFDPLHEALAAPATLIDGLLDAIARELWDRHRPDLVGLTVPFPGNVYGAFRIARAVKARAPATRVVLGGGYVNTELRRVSDARVFDHIDFITLDDGERPLLSLVEHLAAVRAGAREVPPLFRTFVRARGRVVFETTDRVGDFAPRDTGTPSYDGLPLERYVSLFEMLNPMHRLWSDGRWNKLTVAHGCYWKKCAFCDVSLDAIRRYDAVPADLLVDRIQTLVDETGGRGFHFVDEAAPPAALRALAQRLIDRAVMVTWWANVRFERTFTQELTDLLARSGCVAISGGLEVASDRLLKLMQKGVTVAQVARVTRAFTAAGIMVHAYLMYGFPTETEQETVDSLERVRQLFEAGCLQSAYWHRFAATAHSPIGLHPERFGIQLVPEAPATFARNEVAFVDPTGCDHDRLGVGLRQALHNYMHGLGLDADVRTWFDDVDRRGPRRGVPAPKVRRDLIRRALQAH
jgi:radical SAM superfamily enzyme YgiQ (UPF0313 family)